MPPCILPTMIDRGTWVIRVRKLHQTEQRESREIEIKETCEADPHRSCGLLVIGDITRFVEHAPLQIIDHHKADHGSRDRT